MDPSDIPSHGGITAITSAVSVAIGWLGNMLLAARRKEREEDKAEQKEKELTNKFEQVWTELREHGDRLVKMESDQENQCERLDATLDQLKEMRAEIRGELAEIRHLLEKK